jgi:hypothetical protein
MPDHEIGFIELTATTRIIFAIGPWKGQARGSIRKYVTTEKYAGPTKSGMSLDGAIIFQLLAALRAIQSTVPTNNPNQFVAVGKTRDWEIRIGIIPPDGDSKLPSVDIREFVETVRYTGPTKAGVRFPWNKLKQFTQLVEVLVQQLGATVASEPTLFPESQPKWVNEVAQSVGAVEHKSAPHDFDATSLKAFPDAFLPDGKFDAENLTLPPDRFKLGQDRDGHHFVTDESGFHRQVRNEVEGKFLLYAQQRGNTELRLPKEMFKVFSAVAGYERYCRELRQKLVRDLEMRSRNRALAEHMAQETLQTHGLPVC